MTKGFLLSLYSQGDTNASIRTTAVQMFSEHPLLTVRLCQDARPGWITVCFVIYTVYPKVCFNVFELKHEGN
jgi:hypothetical protein